MMSPTKTERTGPAAETRSNTLEEVVLEARALDHDTDPNTNGGKMTTQPNCVAPTSTDQSHGCLEPPPPPTNLGGSLAPIALPCEAEVLALRSHVWQMQAALANTTGDLAHHTKELWRLESENKELRHQLVGLTEGLREPEPSRAGEEVEMQILKTRVDYLEKQRAAKETALHELNQMLNDVGPKAAQAERVVERQDGQIKRLQSRLNWKDKLLNRRAARIRTNDEYVWRQKDEIEVLKLQLMKSERAVRGMRQDNDGFLGDTYVPSSWRKRSHSEGEVREAGQIQGRPGTKRPRLSGSRRNV